MSQLIKADTFEALYCEAAKAMIRGYRIIGTARKLKTGRWYLEMIK